MTRHLEAALFPEESLRAKVSHGGRAGVKVILMKSEGQKGQHAARSPHKVCELFCSLSSSNARPEQM